MRSHHFPTPRGLARSAFTLVEMLVVIAIISILMTAGAIGLGSMGGKGVTSAVASAESIFDEARGIAVGQRTKTRVLVAKNLTGSPDENLRRIVVVSEKLNPNGTPNTGQWELSSRGIVLPDQVYFSQDYSSKKAGGGGGQIDTWNPPLTKNSYKGEYYFYEFNAEGICSTGVSGGSYSAPTFVVGAGSRATKPANAKPRVTAAGKSDFGGFVIWRNGRTSIFRTPAQIDTQLSSMRAGNEF